MIYAGFSQGNTCTSEKVSRTMYMNPEIIYHQVSSNKYD